jgi:capsular polysaccharide transport system ATP-binding protein
MIAFDSITKRYPVSGGMHTVLDKVSFSLARGERFGIIGRNGSGKSTLIRLLAGSELPTSGRVERQMSVSWPLAFTGAFQGSLTGLDNLRFIARVYGVQAHRIQAFVEDFAELGKYFREPVKTYSNGMQARLAFGLSLAIEFDCFLIDEVIAVGDDRFQQKCRHELFEERRDRAFVIVSHDAALIDAYCDRAAVLHAGNLEQFPDVAQALAYYHADAETTAQQWASQVSVEPALEMQS